MITDTIHLDFTNELVEQLDWHSREHLRPGLRNLERTGPTSARGTSS